MPALPRVSCLIHTYKHAPFLARAIESVLNQDYPAELLDIVVIDDGSPDETPEVVQPYVGRLRYIRKAHEGQGSTANPGFAAATGEFIAGMDGDDTWMPFKVRRQVEIMLARPEVGLVYGDMQSIDAEDRVLEPSYYDAHGLLKLSGRVFGQLLAGNPVGGSTTMIRASLLGTFHPVPKHVPYPDWWTALRISEVAEVEFIQEPIIRYRYHGGNFVMYASGERLARLQAGEIPFRRWLLWEYADADVQLDELLRALLELESVTARAASGLGCQAGDLLTVSPQDHNDAAGAFAMMRAAAQAGAPEVALRWLVRSLSRNPWNPTARALLPELVPVARKAAEVHQSRATAQLRQTQGRRSTTVLAHLDELANDLPTSTSASTSASMLKNYAQTFGPADDVTLLVYAPDRSPDDAAQLLTALAPELTADGGPDVELMAMPSGHESSIVESIDAVLSAEDAHAPFNRVQRFEPANLPQLRWFVHSLARDRARN